jgi:UDP-N-acetyl-D-mannosaminuronate dehydrogenase
MIPASTWSLYKLLEGHAEASSPDPHVKEYDYEDNQNITKVRDSDCLIVVTRHKEYLNMKPVNLKNLMNTPIIVIETFNQEECLKLI